MEKGRNNGRDRRVDKEPPPERRGLKGHPFIKPDTRLGWSAVVLGSLFLVMMVLSGRLFSTLPDEVIGRAAALPCNGLIMVTCGLVGGLAAAVALLGRRRRERSLLVWLALLPGLTAFMFLLREYLFLS